MRLKLFLLAASSLGLTTTGAFAQAPVVDEVIVTAAPFAVSINSATSGASVLRRDDLDVAPSGGLGDTLSGSVGVRSSNFGPGASRPVIRGLAGPRVLVLSNGLGQIDASALSPDHAVATDGQEAERIEVLRGPSALAYGGSAIGGIVNVIDGRIATAPVDGVSGRMMAAGSSVDDGKTVSGALHAGAGPLVFSLDGLHRKTRDYKAPTSPESNILTDAEGEEWGGPLDTVVENTASKLTTYGAGVSYVGANGYIGGSVKRTKTTYGVPGHAHAHGEEDHDDHDHDHDHDGHDDHDHEEHEDEAVSIRLKQTRYDLRGEYSFNGALIDKVRFAGGYADYTHVELEDGAPATRFYSKGWEGRVELIQPNRGGWQGAVGVQFLDRDFEAVGAEAYVPPATTTEWGAFAIQRYDRDSWGIEGGLRLDERTIDSVVGKRSFNGVSGSIGGFLRPAEGVFFSLVGSRTERAPSQEELFANGAHPATQGFEVGDANLSSEVSYSADLTGHYGVGRLETDVHLFVNRYEGFIDLRATGNEDADSELPVFAYTQTDARFYGFEVETSYRLWEEGQRSFTLEAAADYVRGKTDLGPPARIPPWSLTGRAVFEGGWWTGKLELQHVAAQNRLADFELPTDDYKLLNASIVFRPIADRGLKLFIDGRNLTNSEAREHVSFLKDLAPLPGRSYRVGVAYSF